MVKAAANTGKLNNSKKLVIKTLQANNGTRFIDIPGARILKIVVIKLIEPNKLLIPEMCKDVINKSIEAEGLIAPDKGG